MAAASLGRAVLMTRGPVVPGVLIMQRRTWWRGATVPTPRPTPHPRSAAVSQVLGPVRAELDAVVRHHAPLPHRRLRHEADERGGRLLLLTQGEEPDERPALAVAGGVEGEGPTRAADPQPDGTAVHGEGVGVVGVPPGDHRADGGHIRGVLQAEL